LTRAELAEARQFALRYGPANRWAGTTGRAPALLHRLLAMVEGDTQFRRQNAQDATQRDATDSSDSTAAGHDNAIQ